MTAFAIGRRLRTPMPWRFVAARLYSRAVIFAIVLAVAYGWAYAGLTRPPQGNAWTALWLSVVGATVLMKVSLAFGPVFVGGDRMFWVLSSPVARGPLLRPRFFGLLAAGAVVGAAWPAVVFGLVGAVVAPLVAVVVGAGVGVAVVACAVVVQRAGVRRARMRLQGWLSGQVGLAVVALLVPPGWVGLAGLSGGVAGVRGPAGMSAGEQGRAGVPGLVAEQGSACVPAGEQGSAGVPGLVGEQGLAGTPVAEGVLPVGEQGWAGVPVAEGVLPVGGPAGDLSSFGPGGALGVALAAWAVAIGLAAVAATSVRHLQRSDLASGGALAGVAQVSVNWFDLALLGAILAERRARLLGRVKSSRPGGTGQGKASRVLALAWTDALRLRRTPNAALAWAALLAVPALVALGGETSSVPAVHLVAAFLATDRLAAGLKFVCRSPAMRRALGMRDRQLKLAYLAFPAAGALLWCAVTTAFTPHVSVLNGAISAVGAVAVVYRIATRPPIDYGAAVIDFGLYGPTPLGLMVQFSRGPALLAVLGLVQLAL
ncbi:DUF6297 family protein [Streptomyces sp. ID05-26A]|nr:DUF6297 family protein [Streptomyces sp. ID05-26A]